METTQTRTKPNCECADVCPFFYNEDLHKSEFVFELAEQIYCGGDSDECALRLIMLGESERAGPGKNLLVCQGRGETGMFGDGGVATGGIAVRDL